MTNPLPTTVKLRPTREGPSIMISLEAPDGTVAMRIKLSYEEALELREALGREVEGLI